MEDFDAPSIKWLREAPVRASHSTLVRKGAGLLISLATDTDLSLFSLKEKRF
jgi:hypothetical protein